MDHDVVEQLYAQLQQAYCQALREYQQESCSMTIKQFCNRYPKLLHTTLASYHKIAVQDPQAVRIDGAWLDRLSRSATDVRKRLKPGLPDKQM